MTSDEKQTLLAKFRGNAPADESCLRRLENEAGLRLPDEYVRLLQYANGGGGFAGNAYLILWRVDELLDMNNGYQVSEYAPGLFLSGSDGGSEAFAFEVDRLFDLRGYTVSSAGSLGIPRPAPPELQPRTAPLAFWGQVFRTGLRSTITPAS